MSAATDPPDLASHPLSQLLSAVFGTTVFAMTVTRKLPTPLTVVAGDRDEEPAMVFADDVAAGLAAARDAGHGRPVVHIEAMYVARSIGALAHLTAGNPVDDGGAALVAVAAASGVETIAVVRVIGFTDGGFGIAPAVAVSPDAVRCLGGPDLVHLVECAAAGVGFGDAEPRGGQPVEVTRFAGEPLRSALSIGYGDTDRDA